MRNFDFEGALMLARHLVDSEKQFALLNARRISSRSDAFAQENFVGPVADKAIRRAESVDEMVAELLPEIVERAWSWAFAWAEAVNETNQEVYEAEAETMKRINEEKRRNYERAVANRRKDSPWPRRPDYGEVEPPRIAPVPVADAFEPDEPPFVSYSSSGVDRIANYTWG